MTSFNQSSFINPAHRLKYTFKTFVKSQDVADTVNLSTKQNRNPIKELSGEEVKDFYESVISESESKKHLVISSEIHTASKLDNHRHSSSNKLSTVPSTSRKKKQICLSKTTILSAIESDNAEIVLLAFSQGWQDEILNSRDQFGWTPLMIAACAGALKTFKILLDKGANLNDKDKSGHTCKSIAKKSNQYTIIDYINSYNSASMQTEKNINEPTTDTTEPVIEGKCDICNIALRSRRLMKQHFSSTIHLLNVERKEIEENGGNPKVHYSISQSNRGFQMMLSNGWDSNLGLGPRGKGKLYPVKTVLKRDRCGLGLNNDDAKSSSCLGKKAKVTHFGPHDASSVKNDKVNKREESVSTMNKKGQIKSKNKEKKKEIDFRREFMTL